MKYRKLAASMFALALIATTATACSGGNESTESDATQADATTKASVVIPDPKDLEPTEDLNEEEQKEGVESGSLPEWLPADSKVDQELINGSLLAHDFRVGVHDDFYRVVIEFVGQGDPGWHVGWVDEGVGIASGHPLNIPQGNVLDVMIHGAGWPIGEGAPELYYNGPAGKRLDENILAWFDDSFEADTHIAISSDKRRDFRVFLLEEPKRLVIDLKK